MLDSVGLAPVLETVVLGQGTGIWSLLVPPPAPWPLCPYPLKASYLSVDNAGSRTEGPLPQTLQACNTEFRG